MKVNKQHKTVFIQSAYLRTFVHPLKKIKNKLDNSYTIIKRTIDYKCTDDRILFYFLNMEMKQGRGYKDEKVRHKAKGKA